MDGCGHRHGDSIRGESKPAHGDSKPAHLRHRLCLVRLVDVCDDGHAKRVLHLLQDPALGYIERELVSACTSSHSGRCMLMTRGTPKVSAAGSCNQQRPGALSVRKEFGVLHGEESACSAEQADTLHHDWSMLFRFSAHALLHAGPLMRRQPVLAKTCKNTLPNRQCPACVLTAGPPPCRAPGRRRPRCGWPCQRSS